MIKELSKTSIEAFGKFVEVFWTKRQFGEFSQSFAGVKFDFGKYRGCQNKTLTNHSSAFPASSPNDYYEIVSGQMIAANKFYQKKSFKSTNN